MTTAFCITTERKEETLVLRLSGNFDRACARQVVDLFSTCKDGASRILVDTSRLEHPDPLELILSEWSSPEPSNEA